MAASPTTLTVTVKVEIDQDSLDTALATIDKLQEQLTEVRQLRDFYGQQLDDMRALRV